MSRKNRPTAASWDSDEDLLQDDILGISAFQSSKEKEESDEELDEDALLGSDNEYEDPPVKKEPLPVKVEKTVTSNAAIPIPTQYQSHVEHVDVYEHVAGPLDTDFAGEDVIDVPDPSELDGFENGAGNLVEVDQDVTSESFGAGDLNVQPLEGLTNERYAHSVNDYESFQNQEEDYEDKTIKGFDESSDSEDEEKGRGRFISERSNIISIATTKPKTRTDIPDTLEISEEQQAQIDQFLNERNRRGGRRGYRGGQNRGMRGGRQPVYGAWQDTSNVNQKQPVHHQMPEQKKTAHYQHHQQPQHHHHHQQQSQQPQQQHHLQQQPIPTMTHRESEVYPIPITCQSNYNTSHNQPRESSQPQQQQQQHQQQHYHHPIQQPPPTPSHPSQPASHQSHVYQQQPVVSQHEAAIQPHYAQPAPLNPAPQLAPPASTPNVQLTHGNNTTSHQQGRKILINPHFRGAKLDAPPPQVPPVISSTSAMASASLLPQQHQHYQPVPQQTTYVQHTAEVWPTPAQPQHSYQATTPPVIHSQTHYNPVSHSYQAASVLQHPTLSHQQVQQIPAAPSVVTQISPIPTQYSGAPQPIQSLAPMPSPQPAAVYPPASQQYQSTVPPRPVADQSMMFRQPPPQLPPAPQVAPSHFMSSPPQQPPQPPFTPSHIHPPLQTSMPPPHPNTSGAPPPLQSFQSRPQQYHVQSAPHPTEQPQSHQVHLPQHQLHHSSVTPQKIHPTQSQYQRTHLVNNPVSRTNVYNKVHRKYQRIRGNLLVSPKRKRQEIQTQQNKNIKVLTSLPQVKLMSDVNEPPNKIAKVSTHLKQLTRSDDSLDEESKSMREKLELQKRMRAEVIRRKELRRLMHAEQRRKDLQEKLAEQGLTLADISEEQKATFMEETPYKTVNKTFQPQAKPNLGKRPLQPTPGQNTTYVAGIKRTSPQQLAGRPVKQVKVGPGQIVSQPSQDKDKSTAGQPQAQPVKVEEKQAANNVILSEEQKNFYQKQYIPPHQQFQSVSTTKKVKRVLPNKNPEQKTQALPQKQEESKPGQSATPKTKEQQQQQQPPPAPKNALQQPQSRPLRGGKSRGFQGRMLSSQIRMPNPNQGQMYGQQRPVSPGLNQHRPVGMQGHLRPGQPRHHILGGPRPMPSGNIRPPPPAGLRHPSSGVLRHPGFQGHPRPMRGQPHLLGPPRQPRNAQEQMRPPYSPGQPRFMPPGGQQRPMMQGRGGVRGINIRGRGRGMPGRGGHLLPICPGGDVPHPPTPPQANTKPVLSSPKPEILRKNKLVYKKVVKAPDSQQAAPNKPAAAGGKKLINKNPNQTGGHPQINPGNQDKKTQLMKHPVNRQIRMQGSKAAGCQDRQGKFPNPSMGRGQPIRPMGMGPNARKGPGNLAAGKEQPNVGRRTLLDGDGNLGKKATMIAVDNLSSSTTERTINQMAKACGQVESLQLLKSQRKALIRFRSGEEAQHFFKKFHRHMLDLSHINVTVLPAY